MNLRIFKACALALCLAATLTASAQQSDGLKNLRVSKQTAKQTINVAFVISHGATVIDFTGPWDVFASAMITSDLKPDNDMHDMNNMIMPFNTYIVAENKEPITVEGGMVIVPNYSFDDAPKAQVIVVPAQGSRTAAFEKWLKKSA